MIPSSEIGAFRGREAAERYPAEGFSQIKDPAATIRTCERLMERLDDEQN